MKNIAVLVSGAGTNAENIIRYFVNSEKVNISVVVSDNPSAYALTRAQRLDIETVSLTRKDFRDGTRPLAELRKRNIDVVVLAGFLSIIPRVLLEAFPGRIINIHPSLLPKFGGKGMYSDNVHRAVIEAGESVSGITIHTIDEHVDRGVVLAQFTTPVAEDDTPETLAGKIHALEYKHYPEIIESFITKITDMENRRKLLLISNSTTAGEPYLKYPIGNIAQFLKGVSEVAFVPYAAVTFSYDEYEAKVQARFDEIGIKVRSIHHAENPAEAIRNAEAVCVGGGNTFALLRAMQELGVVEAIREKIAEGIPYVGWSAGSNVCCPTICTTNDMPIVQPQSFAAIGAVKFQINPHYLDTHPEGHAGETREQRIEEYIEANDGMWVAGLREGCMLLVEGNQMQLIGARPMRIFRRGDKPFEVEPGGDLSFLM